jgi:hypothetical protein
MPILKSNNGSILDRGILFCTQTYYANTDHRFLLVLIVSFPFSFCIIICVVKL